MGQDRRQKPSPFAVAKLRLDPRLPLCIRNSQPVEEILLQAVKTLLAINQNFTVFGQCPVTALWLVPVTREVAPKIRS